MVTRKQIRHWVEQVNSEYGLTDRNEESVEFFWSLRKYLVFIVKKEWYLVLFPSFDMWGRRTLSVVSFCIEKELRNNPKYLREVYREVLSVAKKYNSEYIIAGSHLNSKFNDFLQKTGFKQLNFIKEIK